jgi:hypothetical protein
MSNEFSSSENPDDLKHVEQTLAAMSPRPAQIDRDRLMFLAGAASVQGSGVRVQGLGVRVQGSGRAMAGRAWPAATAALGATSLALVIALIVQTNTSPQIVYVERPAPAAPAMTPQVAIQNAQSPDLPVTETETAAAPRPAARLAPVPTDNYLRTRDVALRMGLDALGSSRSAGGNSSSPLTYFDWLAGFGNDSTSLVPGSASDSPLPQM